MTRLKILLFTQWHHLLLVLMHLLAYFDLLCVCQLVIRIQPPHHLNFQTYFIYIYFLFLVCYLFFLNFLWSCDCCLRSLMSVLLILHHLYLLLLNSNVWIKKNDRAIRLSFDVDFLLVLFRLIVHCYLCFSMFRCVSLCLFSPLFQFIIQYFH